MTGTLTTIESQWKKKYRNIWKSADTRLLKIILVSAFIISNLNTFLPQHRITKCPEASFSGTSIFLERALLTVLFVRCSTETCWILDTRSSICSFEKKNINYICQFCKQALCEVRQRTGTEAGLWRREELEEFKALPTWTLWSEPA